MSAALLRDRRNRGGHPFNATKSLTSISFFLFLFIFLFELTSNPTQKFMPAGFDKFFSERLLNPAHHADEKHKVKPSTTKHIVLSDHASSTQQMTFTPTTTSLSYSAPSSISILSPALSTTAPSPIVEGTILTGSSLPVPLSPASSPSSIANTPMIIGFVIGGFVMISSVMCYILHRRIRRKKDLGPTEAAAREVPDNKDNASHKNGEKWKATELWSTLDSTASRKYVEMDAPPPAYYSFTRNQKRLTPELVANKQASLFVKQYSPQLAYSPSNHTTLQIDQSTLSPSHTLVDTRRSSSCLQPSEDDEKQQRRSFQPYPAQLDITPSMINALKPPGPYQGGMLLHTKEFDPF